MEAEIPPVDYILGNATCKETGEDDQSRLLAQLCCSQCQDKRRDKRNQERQQTGRPSPGKGVDEDVVSMGGPAIQESVSLNRVGDSSPPAPTRGFDHHRFQNVAHTEVRLLIVGSSSTIKATNASAAPARTTALVGRVM